MRTENITLEMFSRQEQRKKSIDLLAGQSSVSRGNLHLVESLASCSCREIVVSQVLWGMASSEQRTAWALQYWDHNTEWTSGVELPVCTRDRGEKSGAHGWSSRFLSYAPGELQFLQVTVLSILWLLQMPLLARFAVWALPPAVCLSGYSGTAPSSARASQQRAVTWIAAATAPWKSTLEEELSAAARVR